MKKEMLSSRVIEWVRDWFEENGRETAVLGISGGKDSAAVAALLVHAIGKDNVVGVLIPDGEQKDIDDSIRVVEELGIRSYTVNIGAAHKALSGAVAAAIGAPVSEDAEVNVPPRLRMTVLYTVAQTLSNREQAKACVIGTGNAAELYVGYCTKWGDMGSDMNPLKNLWVDEVLQIGDELGYFPDIIHKAPADGLCGLSDEDRLGFTYGQVRELNEGVLLDESIASLIEQKHRAALHKLNPVPGFEE